MFFLDDITVKGFEQLSIIRAFLPKTQAFLMDKTAFDAFPQHHATIHETIKATSNTPHFLPHLTQVEQSFYQYLLSLKEKNGLLQKNISYAFLQKALNSHFS